MDKIHVLLIDEHALVRKAIVALLQRMPEIESIEEAASGPEALKLLKSHRSDLVLMDTALPDMSGLQVIARIRNAFPKLRVLMLSMHTSQGYIQQALRAGARGYVVKGATPAQLETAIRMVLMGGQYVTPIEGCQEYPPVASAIKANRSSLASLTARQRQVLQLIAHSYTNREIAQKLKISVNTVQRHRAQIMQRLSVHGTAQLVRLAAEAGPI